MPNPGVDEPLVNAATAQLEIKLCRSTCQLRSAAHLLPASVCLRWWWASSRVIGVALVPPFSSGKPWPSGRRRVAPPGWAASQIVSTPVSKGESGTRRVERLSLQPLLLPNNDDPRIQVDVGNPAPDDLASARARVRGEADHWIEEWVQLARPDELQDLSDLGKSEEQAVPEFLGGGADEALPARSAARSPPGSGTAASPRPSGI